SLAVLLLLVIGGGVYWKHGMPSRLPAQALAYQNTDLGSPFFTNTYPRSEFLELGVQSTIQPIEILLWGDSHAMAVAPALDELCRTFSVRGVQATHLGLAPILGKVHLIYRREGFDSPDFGRTIADCVAKEHVRAV